MGHAIVLGFGFCVGIVLFCIVVNIFVAILTTPSQPKPPPTARQIAAKERRKQIGEWLHMSFGVLCLFAALIFWTADATGLIPPAKSASHGVTSTGVTWRMITP